MVRGGEDEQPARRDGKQHAVNVGAVHGRGCGSSVGARTSEVSSPRNARDSWAPKGGPGGSRTPTASSMKLEARTPVLALRETAVQHAADGNANLAECTGRERVVGPPRAAHHRAHCRCEVLRMSSITCQLQVQGEQRPRPVEGLHEGIKCYLAACQCGKPFRCVRGQGSQRRVRINPWMLGSDSAQKDRAESVQGRARLLLTPASRRLSNLEEMGAARLDCRR